MLTVAKANKPTSLVRAALKRLWFQMLFSTKTCQDFETQWCVYFYCSTWKAVLQQREKSDDDDDDDDEV